VHCLYDVKNGSLIKHC